MDTTALNATVDCSKGRPSRNAPTIENRMAYMGVFVRLLILLQMWEKGTPLSRLKPKIWTAQTALDQASPGTW